MADALEKIKIGGKTPIVDVEDGIENTISGPAVRLHRGSAMAAERAGFTPQELEHDRQSRSCEGEPAPTPVVVNDRAVHDPRALPGVDARVARGDEQHAARQLERDDRRRSDRWPTIDELPGQTEIRRENLQRYVEVTARLEGVDLGTGVAAVQKAVADLKLPPSIRVEYGGTYQEQQKSFRDLAIVLVLAVVLVFLVLLFEFRIFTAPIAILSSAMLSTSGVLLRAARHAHDVQRVVVHGPDHGDRHRRQERHPAARRRTSKFRAEGMSRRGSDRSRPGARRLRPIVMTALAAVAGMLPLALALGAGSQMLQPLAIAVIGGILVSMVLSLIVTPAIQYFLER